ncbi:unnamed protein product [Meloidogyne enterolobii]|uniref:Uncharacterized protein n=1 Tax=Meloidogyne enterolobii TaxID=390850 RepID=A0ACB0Y979_MELEN
MWNSKYITEFQLPSTKNSVEFWHRNLQNIWSSLRQNFFRFLVRILNENEKVDVLCSKLDAGEEVFIIFILYLGGLGCPPFYVLYPYLCYSVFFFDI